MSKQTTTLLLILISLVSCKKDVLDEKIKTETLSVNAKAVEYASKMGSSATVVLISGHASELQTWAKLYKLIPAEYSVFVYNRPGVGRSENVEGKRDAKTIATELLQVLQKANMPSPYILVGHSIGGIYARIFYHQNKEKVKGLVLVDATHEKQIDSVLSILPAEQVQLITKGMEDQFKAELANIPDGCIKEEYKSNYKENYEQMKTFQPINNLPFYAITSTKIEGSPLMVEVKAELTRQLVTGAGAKGKFVATNKSGHLIQLTEPDLIVNGIKWVAEH